MGVFTSIFHQNNLKYIWGLNFNFAWTKLIPISNKMKSFQFDYFEILNFIPVHKTDI